MKNEIEKIQNSQQSILDVAYVPVGEEDKKGNGIHGVGWEYRCAYCGKTFFVPIRTRYRYKLSTSKGVKWFCIWSCMEKFRKDKENCGKRKS